MAQLKLAINARDAVSGLKKLDSGIQSTTRVLNNLKNDGANALNKIGKATNLALAPLKAMVSVSANAKAAALAMGTASVKAAGDYEIFNNQLRTVIATKNEADKAFKESLDFAIATPFTPDEIVRTRVELEAVGVRGSKAVEEVASAAAAMNREIGDVTAAVKSMETEPLRMLGIQLSKSGDDFVFEFSDKVGQARQIAASGFEEAQHALLNIFDLKFEGGIDKMSDTLYGLRSTWDGVFKSLQADFGGGMIDEVKIVIQDMIGGANSLRSNVKEAGVAFGDQIWKARAAILATLDVSRQIGSQISGAFEAGGTGEVILKTMELGATILGQGIMSAFEISLPLWKTLGTILGQGAIAALYQSNLPFMGRARKNSVEKNINSMSFDKFKDVAKELGIPIDHYSVSIPSNATWNSLDEYNALRTVSPTDKDIERVLEAISKLPPDQQIDYALFDPSTTISNSISEAQSKVASEIEEFGTNSISILQHYADGISSIAGLKAVDINTIWQDSNKKYLERPSNSMDTSNLEMSYYEKLLSGDLQGSLGIKEKVVKSDSVSRNSGGYSYGSKSPIDTSAAERAAGMIKNLDTELFLISKTNDEREKSIELEAYRKELSNAYGSDVTKINELMGVYQEKLTALQHARGLRTIADGIGNSFANAFERMITGAATAGDAIKALAQDIMSLVMKQMVTAPIASAISSGTMGLFSNLGIYASMSNPLTPTWAGTNTGSSAMIGAKVSHAGGIVGDTTATRNVPLSLFNNAPRYHNGLASDEFPTILQRGETVIPKGGSVAVSPPNVAVNVINKGSNQMEAKQGDTKFDGKNFVTEIILNDIHKNGPIRGAIKSMN